MSHEGQKIKCPGCGRVIYQTTKSYRPGVGPTGDMLELLEPWKSRGWGKYENGYYGGKSIMASEMLCTECGNPLSSSGRFLFVKPTFFECELCGWVGKTSPALKRHMTVNHNDEPKPRLQLKQNPPEGA